MDTQGDRRWGQVGLNLALNIVIPVVILLRLSGEGLLGPMRALVLALAFPVVYGLYDLVWRREYNFYAIIGFVSVLLTGGIGLAELDPMWLAVKEAAVPLIIGLVILMSQNTKYPLAEMLLNKVIDKDRVQKVLLEKGLLGAYRRRLTAVVYLVTGSFFLSATLNFLLARYLVVSPPGTPAFNEELAKLTALSYPIVALPSMIVLWLAIIWLVRGISALTGFNLKQIFRM